MIEKTEKEIMKNWQGDISEPVVSICCITYNHEQYISEAINSFLMQETDFPFEIVIGEDCSTDNTRKVVEKYKEMYPNIIKLIVSENNVGMLANVQRTMEACIGEYMALCEGDDYWTDKNKLQIQVEQLKKYPNIDICFHPAYKLYNKKFVGKQGLHSRKDRIFTIEEVILGEGGFMPTNSLLIKKDVIDNLPKWFYNEAPIGDYYLQIFGSRKGGALYINNTMSAYRLNATSSWSNSMKNKEKIKEYREKTDICYNYLFDEFDEKYHLAIKRVLTKSNFATLSKIELDLEYKRELYFKIKSLFSIREKLIWNMIFSKPKILKFILYFYGKIK